MICSERVKSGLRNDKESDLVLYRDYFGILETRLVLGFLLFSVRWMLLL